MRQRLLMTSTPGGLLVPDRSAAMFASRVAPAVLNLIPSANTLTAIIPQLYAALDVVSRELAGFIPSSSRSSSAERAAVGQSITYPIAPAQLAYDVAPAMAIPEPPDNTAVVGTMAITKSRAVAFGITGEEQTALNSGNGPGWLSTQGQWFAQALRTLVNEVEADGAAEASANASRAYGTSGQTPFDPTSTAPLKDMAFVRKILDDNGAPPSDRSMVLNTSAGANLRSVPNLTRVNEAGNQMTLRQGELLDIHGFSVKESGQAVSKTAGTAASATTNAAGYAVGATTITLASAGTGTFVAGDVVSFAGDTEKYVVVTGDADTSNGGTIVISAPGLRKAIPAVATLITRSASYSANVAFSQSALHVAMRAPAMPSEGDARLDTINLTDPRTGVTFEVSIWPGYRKVRGEVALAWGWKASKREHIALLLG
jgi:hypothetical protein